MFDTITKDVPPWVWGSEGSLGKPLRVPLKQSLLGNNVEACKNALKSGQPLSETRTPQGAHLDFPAAGAPKGVWHPDHLHMVVIRALEERLRLMLWPGMHLLIVACAHYHGWTLENGFRRSTADIDITFAGMISVLLAKGMLFPVLVQLEVGEQIIFDGRLPHQGAPALLASQSPLDDSQLQSDAVRAWLRAMRAHMYVIPAEADRTAYMAGDGKTPASFPLGRMAPYLHSQALACMFADISRLARQ